MGIFDKNNDSQLNIKNITSSAEHYSDLEDDDDNKSFITNNVINPQIANTPIIVTEHDLKHFSDPKVVNPSVKQVGDIDLDHISDPVIDPDHYPGEDDYNMPTEPPPFPVNRPLFSDDNKPEDLRPADWEGLNKPEAIVSNPIPAPQNPQPDIQLVGDIDLDHISNPQTIGTPVIVTEHDLKHFSDPKVVNPSVKQVGDIDLDHISDPVIDPDANKPVIVTEHDLEHFSDPKIVNPSVKQVGDVNLDHIINPQKAVEPPGTEHINYNLPGDVAQPKAVEPSGTEHINYNLRDDVATESKIISFGDDAIPSEPKTISFGDDAIPSDPKTISFGDDAIPSDPGKDNLEPVPEVSQDPNQTYGEFISFLVEQVEKLLPDLYAKIKSSIYDEVGNDMYQNYEQLFTDFTLQNFEHIYAEIKTDFYTVDFNEPTVCRSEFVGLDFDSILDTSLVDNGLDLIIATANESVDTFKEASKQSHKGAFDVFLGEDALPNVDTSNII